MTADSTGEPVLWWLDICLREESTMRSSEHAAHRLLMHMCSHIALVAQGLALCVIPYHPCMRTCVFVT